MWYDGAVKVSWWIVLILFLAGFAALNIWVYPRVPGRIPVHFALDGTPDVWHAKTPLAWFTPFVISLGFSLLFFILAVTIRRIGAKNPAVLSIPMKSAFLKLPPDRRTFAFDAMEEFLALQAVLLSLLFFSIQVATYAYLVKEIPVNTIVFPVFTVYTLVITVSTIAFYAVLKRRIEEEVRAFLQE